MVLYSLYGNSRLERLIPLSPTMFSHAAVALLIMLDFIYPEIYHIGVLYVIELRAAAPGTAPAKLS